tara:strand:- start:284 stop:985 length:702 start_codon:yes stop_codon:yes gene_type:complete
MSRTRQNLSTLLMEAHMVSYNLYNIPVYFKDKFIDQDIDVEAAMDEIEQRVPSQFLYGIDTIFVGSFEDFDNKNTNAKLENGAIYVSNEQDSEEDMIDDIVHEIAHNVENLYGESIYADSAVEVEFLGKRKRLLQILQAEYGHDAVKSVVSGFLDPEYSEKFDEFLYKVVGYPSLVSLSMGLFVSPYGATSLREYFASAFEHYFLQDAEYVRTVSPAVYKKIEKTLQESQEIN